MKAVSKLRIKIIPTLKKYFRNILLGTNLFFAALMLLSYLSPHVSPQDFYPLAFLGLIYPFLLLINVVFIVIWLFQKSKLLLISLLSILFGIEFISNLVHFNVDANENFNHQSSYKLLSYNVRIFNLWKWAAEENRSTRIYDFIRKSNANIVCLQEFYSKNEPGLDAEDSIITNSILKYAHIAYTPGIEKNNHYGIATFSSFPIIEKGVVQIGPMDNFCIFSDLAVNMDTIRLYNIHLESVHLGTDDYRLIENMNADDSLDVEGLRSIYWKFKKSYKVRASQVNRIISHIKTSKYPVILCGDFNDTPYSYVYGQLTKYLKDSFRVSGNGFGYTYINKYPAFRIDYILHSPELRSFGFKSVKVKLSDHYPVECFFKN